MLTVAPNSGSDPRQMDAANRGASLVWLSQFPAESEVLFPPLVVLEVIGDPQYKADQLHYQFRLT